MSFLQEMSLRDQEPFGLAEALNNALKALIGQTVVDGTAGAPFGSIVHLDFSNGFVLHVHCAWRLTDGTIPITGWRENNDYSTGPLPLGIRSLFSDRVITVDLNPRFDLVVTFATGKSLGLFCDLTSNYEEEGETNWLLAIPMLNTTYRVTNQLRLAQGEWG